MSELQSLCKARGITVESKFVRLVTRNADGSPIDWPHDLWECVVSYQGRVYGCEYRTGLGHRRAQCGVERSGKGYYSKVAQAYARDLVDASELGWLVVVKPDVADVVSCLVSDASSAEESFDAWCDSLGYSNDSIKALDTYRACQRTRDALIRLFGSELLSELSSAEH